MKREMKARLTPTGRMLARHWQAADAFGKTSWQFRHVWLRSAAAARRSPALLPQPPLQLPRPASSPIRQVWHGICLCLLLSCLAALNTHPAAAVLYKTPSSGSSTEHVPSAAVLYKTPSSGSSTEHAPLDCSVLCRGADLPPCCVAGPSPALHHPTFSGHGQQAQQPPISYTAMPPSG
jgi:hypothetical protein